MKLDDKIFKRALKENGIIRWEKHFKDVVESYIAIYEQEQAKVNTCVIADVSDLFCDECGTRFEYDWIVEYSRCPKCQCDLAK